MDYSIHDAQQAGFTRVVFLIREEMREQFEQQVGSKYDGILDVDYAYQNKNDLPAGFTCPSERERPWGTGHAVWAAREALGKSPFAVINADDYYGAETFEVLMQSFQEMSDSNSQTNLFSMVGFRLSETLSSMAWYPVEFVKNQTGTLNRLRNGRRLEELPLPDLMLKWKRVHSMVLKLYQ